MGENSRQEGQTISRTGSVEKPTTVKIDNEERRR
jgi:hypothetical protein